MYLLHCPQGHPLPVSPTAAGSQVTCPQCGSVLNVPKLGELRSLPQVQPGTAERRRTTLGFGARLAFSVLLLGALASGICSAYAAVRWRNMPVPMTTEEHIRASTEEIAQLPPATLVSIWEHYQHEGLGVRTPFPYQHVQQLRDQWKQTCLITLAIAGLCLAAAVGAAILGRQPADAGDT